MNVKVLGPALAAALLLIVGVVRLWGGDAGSEAGAALLGAGLVLTGMAVWAAVHKD